MNRYITIQTNLQVAQLIVEGHSIETEAIILQYTIKNFKKREVYLFEIEEEKRALSARFLLTAESIHETF